MKRIIIFAMLISLFIFKIEAQTSIDQSYFSSNQPVYIWESGGSPYLIQTDIEIPWGSNLIINPGVEVRFEGHFKLEVKGSINAIGTNHERIIITSNDGKPWNGIRFDFSDGTDHSHSKLHYCNISNSKKNTTGYFDYEPQCAGGAIYIREFSDLEVVNCKIFGNEASEGQGGAIGIYDNSSPLIEYNSIHDNNAFKRGGAISIMNGCNPIIHNNKICDNHSSKGGGAIAIGDLAPMNGSASNPEIRWNYIYNNSTSGINGNYGDGGAIFICGSNPEISENTIEDNSAFGEGGGIFIKDNSDVSLESNSFYNNSSAKDGGGLYCHNSILNSIHNCQFSDNTAINGGGIYIYNSTSTIDNCTFQENTATGNGGGIYMNDPVSNTISLNTFTTNEAYNGSAIFYFRINNGPNFQNPTYILNNLIVVNIANNMGAVYFSENNINTVFNHNTVTNNTSNTSISGLVVDDKDYFPRLVGSCNFNNNIVYGNTNVVYIVTATPLEWSYFLMDIYASPNCTYVTNPGFVSSSDYHLSSSSVCIDAGDNSASMTPLDLDGNQRINNGTTDYGCFEY